MALVWIIIFLVLLFIYARRERSFFARRGVKSIPYTFPLLGNMYKAVTKQSHLKDMISETYNAFPDQKYVGHKQFQMPIIMIRDLDLLKQATIKDFEHFLGHLGALDEKVDYLWGNNLLSLTGDKWRDMRGTLSPAFTSSKMRNMFVLVEEIGRDTTQYFVEEMKKPENEVRGLVEIEMKDIFTRYTNDVIATSVFGIRVNSLADRKNHFYQQGKTLSGNFSGLQILKFLILYNFPRFSQFMNLKVFDQRVSNYFRNLVLDNMAERKERNIYRPDMVQLLMDAQKGTLRHDTVTNEDQDDGFATVKESQVGKRVSKRTWKDDEIVAQAVLFFLAGFDTSSTLLCFVSHELMVNPEVQRKLQDEIDGVISKHGPILNYNHLNEMKYMDMVVSETLRMWPPSPSTDRMCTKPYTLPPANENSSPYKLEIGDVIWVPVYGLHHDPQYHPNPSKFDPERFSDQNKHKIHPMTFLPFGVGPRNCIGSRFALMEVKAVIFHLLSKFDFVETAKTQNPIIISNGSFTLQASKGFWLGLKPRV